jgi:septal ring factor EnvC (AmiA/AmiB activator)
MALGFIRLVVLVTGLLAGALGAAPAGAEEHASIAAAKLEKIRADVGRTESKIEAIQGDFNQLVARRNEVTESLTRLKREDQVLERKLLEVEEQRKALVVRVDEAEKRLAQEREKSARRLRALYIQASVDNGPLMLRQVDPGQVERVSVYSRAVRGGDNRRVESMRRLAEELVAAKGQLEESIQEAQKLRGEIRMMREDAERKQKELQRIAKEIKARKEAAQQSLALLNKEAQELEKFIASLTAGEPDEDKSQGNAEEHEPPEEKQQEAEADTPAQSERASMPKLDPRGLFGAGVTLVAPVKGEVVQRFGKVRLASFRDVLFSKGIEFSAKDNDEVHAVLGGTVAYAGNLPGYDTVVIVDHGARSYSLYGRLGSALVKKEQVIGSDEVLGTTSIADKRGRNFYFEVRRSGKPVDPEGVLARLSR